MTDPDEIARATALVEDAFARGQAALARDDTVEGVRWLDRARRLAPGEDTIRLTLASALVSLDPQRAAALFEEVIEATGSRDA